jgi:hypothetical protein
MELFVSQSGNDENTGTRASPLLTVAGAIRRGRGLDVMSSLVVGLEPGTYRGGALPLFPSDSGVTFQCLGDPGEAIVSGSVVLTGWEVFDGDIYRAPLPGTLPVRTLFEDGVRARAARFPKFIANPLYETAQAPYLLSFSVGEPDPHTQIEYDPGDLDPSTWTIPGPQVRPWSGGGIAWFTDTIPLIAVNLGLNLLGFGPPSRYVCYGPAGSRYFIQNVLELLTEPGEFYSDNTHVYYMFNGDPEEAVIEVPVASDVFALLGQPANYVQDVTFDGLCIEGTTIPTWYRHAHVNDGEGFTDRDRGPTDGLASSDPYDRQMTLEQNRRGLIRLINTQNVHVDNCRLRNSGLSAIYAWGVNLGHVIENSWLEKTGHSGIYADGQYPGGGDTSRDWTVSDVKVNNVGQLVGNGCGMIFINSGHHTVSNCELSKGPRNAFFVGAYTDISPASNCYARGIVFELSEMTDFCQDSGDVGTLGIGGLSSLEGGPHLVNTFRQLRITGANADPSMTDSDPNCVFTDNQSFGQVFQNVDASDAQGAVMRINDSGEHTATNCTFNADGTTNESFNPALMSPDIGLTSDFPF